MGSTKPFGGISVLAVGDLYQLKPVFDYWVFVNLIGDYGPLATNLWVELLKVHFLTEVMRQKDDIIYSQFVNRLRIGQHTT